nr:membrane protein insertion efficiency factor YidD [Haliscomenobacter sp.]
MNLLKDTWRALFIFPIRIYQWTIGPWLPSKCAYHPTCSRYTVAAIQE